MYTKRPRWFCSFCCGNGVNYSLCMGRKPGLWHSGVNMDRVSTKCLILTLYKILPTESTELCAPCWHLQYVWFVCRVQLKCDGTQWRREGKWRGNWRMEWVAITFHTTSAQVYPALLPLMRTPRLPVVDWTDVPVDLNGLVRFAERRNLVSARVPSHFKRSLLYVSVLAICRADVALH
jgi:hypothetical protein